MMSEIWIWTSVYSVACLAALALAWKIVKNSEKDEEDE